MAVAAFHAAGSKASRLCLFGYFIVVTIGELQPSPVGLSLVTKVAPGRILSMMMGVWLATSFVVNFLAGIIGSFWSQTDKPVFFLIVAVIAAIAGAAIFAPVIGRCAARCRSEAKLTGRGSPLPTRLPSSDMLRGAGARVANSRRV
jgi:dipeptide/tripeptide permease